VIDTREAIVFPDLKIDWPAVETAAKVETKVAVETSAKIELLPVPFIARDEPAVTPPPPELIAAEEDTYVPPQIEQRLIYHWLRNGGESSIVAAAPPPPEDANVTPFRARGEGDGVHRCIRLHN
jgi:hypothetical protein